MMDGDPTPFKENMSHLGTPDDVSTFPTEATSDKTVMVAGREGYKDLNTSMLELGRDGMEDPYKLQVENSIPKGSICVPRGKSTFLARTTPFPSYASIQTHGDTMKSMSVQGDRASESAVPSNHQNEQKNADSASLLVTGTDKKLRISEDLLVKARALIHDVCWGDCSPKALSLIVTSDVLPLPPSGAKITSQNNSVQGDCSSSQSNDEPKLDSKLSCEMLKNACERFGIAVLPLDNSSVEYLLAVLRVLSDEGEGIPSSCKLFWVIFTGHGRANEICINGDFVRFEDLIQAVSKTEMKNMMIIFECCLLSACIRVAEVSTPHMVIYSAPPNELSYHLDGVGFLTRSFAKLLDDNYDKSMNDFQLDLRRETVDLMISLSNEMKMSKKELEEKHVPVHTDNMIDDINPYAIIHDAMRPTIDSVTTINDGKTAYVEILGPKRMLHHSSFELEEYQITLRYNDGRESVLLKTLKAAFSEDVVSEYVTLPPTVQSTRAELIVAAKYTGRSVNSTPYRVEELPLYGEPRIERCTVDTTTNCTANATISFPNEGGRGHYKVEYIDIGYFKTPSREWQSLHRQEGNHYSTNITLTLFPSLKPVDRELIIAMKYESCLEVIYSKTYFMKQPGICEPRIERCTVDTTTNCTANATISVPNEGGRGHYKVEYIDIGYFKTPSREWQSLHRQKGNHYSTNITLTLFPSSKPVDRELIIAMKYDSCLEVVYSKTYLMKQPGIFKPTLSVENCDSGFRKRIKFSVSQHVPASNAQRYEIENCSIKHRIRGNNRNWIRAIDLSPNDISRTGENSVTIKSHLSDKGVDCEYRVALKYRHLSDDVESIICVHRIEPLELPCVQSLSHSSHGTSTLEWTHGSHDTNVPLKYRVIDIDHPEELLDECDVSKTSFTINRRLDYRNILRVGIHHANDDNGDELGCVYSKSFIESKFRHNLWVLKKCYRAYLFLNISLFCAVISLQTIIPTLWFFFPLHSQSLLPQQIMADQTIHLPFLYPSWLQEIWYDGFIISEDTNGTSDNPNGIPITPLLLDSKELQTQNRTVVFDRDRNRTIESEEQRSLIPFNYLDDPIFCLKGSVIETRFRIHRLSPESDTVYSAIVYFFIWRTEPDVDVSLRSAVHRVYITNSVNEFVTDDFEVSSDSYFYFVLVSSSDATFYFVSNFTFHALTYTNTRGNSTVETIAKNNSVFIPFDGSKVLLFYAHPVSDDEQQQVHLKFVYAARKASQVFFLVLTFLIFSISGGLSFLFLFHKFCKKLCNNSCRSYHGYKSLDIPV